MPGTVKGDPPPGMRGGPTTFYRMAENLQLLGYRVLPVHQDS